MFYPHSRKGSRDLYDAGCRSVEDLRKPEFHDKLTPTQKFGLLHAENIRMPVTRTEAELVTVRAMSFTLRRP